MKKILIIAVIILASAITAWSFTSKPANAKSEISATEKTKLSNTATPHRNDIGSAD